MYSHVLHNARHGKCFRLQAMRNNTCENYCLLSVQLIASLDDGVISNLVLCKY